MPEAGDGVIFERVVNCGRDTGIVKISVKNASGGHTFVACGTLAHPHALIVGEKHQLVLLDGTSEGGAKRILLIFGQLGPLQIREEGGRIQMVVANELMEFSVVAVGPTLGDYVDGRNTAAELGVHIATLNLNF